MTDHAEINVGHDSGDMASDDSTSPVGGVHHLITTPPQGVQIQILQQGQGNEHNVPQSLFGQGQDIASAQIAFSSLSAGKQQEVLAACQQQLLHMSSNKQQEVLAACQQQLLQTLRTSISSIVVPSGVVQSGVALVGGPGTTISQAVAGSIPGHFVTPYDGGSSQVNSLSSTQQVTAIGSVPITSAYDISQAQALYTQQLVANHRSQVNKLVAASPSTRACPEIIKWLLENYETAEGVSLPRSTLYNHYLRHCAAKKIDAVNAASFGKLIRSLFIGLKTRRLGTRGSSKYHYYGIRIKPDSPLSTYLMDEGPLVAMRQPSATQKDFVASDSGNGDTGLDAQSGLLAPHEQHQQYLGEHRPELDQFPYPEWEGQRLPDGITIDDLSEFIALYREHCEAILDVVTNLQFQMVENLWQLFWGDNSKSSTGDAHSDDDGDHRMPPEKLMILTMFQPLVEYIVMCDHILYQCIVDFLIPSVLRSIPATLTQAIRNFAKSLESWMKSVMQSYPQPCFQAKVSSVIAFSQTLRRYTSLNHLAQAARAVLQNSSQISQMVTDLNRVDFSNVQEQASWVCQCDEAVVTRLEHDFKTTLQQQKSLEQWAVWMEDVVDTVLQSYKDTENYSKAARQFLLKWSFYSSMVIRDLTLRSAASFGSFHLIRLLYDEYMFYLIEHKVARASGKTPIAVMTEFSKMAKVGFDLAANTSTTEQTDVELSSRKRMTGYSSDQDFESPAKKLYDRPDPTTS